MPNLEKRIAALEAEQPDYPFLAVRLALGETVEAARLRCCIPADAMNVLFIERVIVDPPSAEDGEL